ncbi:MAG: hypothetical protein A2X56_01700 [Nitrospirae bacterium GWC2_57_13]|nr:MAG: hypothetical protein A2X56_01700 [Nitrospirae bacterium GWC2_57_13]HAS55100.1 hypothetical protein [Nitrospiraceae bacterium]
MKNFTRGLILIFVGTIVSSSPGFAEEKRKTIRYAGVVQDVNTRDKTIVVGKEKKSLAMLFDAANAAFLNVEGLQDLKVGDRVVIDYDAERGKTIAITVTKEP